MELFSVSAFALWLGWSLVCLSGEVAGRGGDLLDSSTHSSYTIIVCSLDFDAHIQCCTVAWTVIPGFGCCTEFSFSFLSTQVVQYIRTWPCKVFSDLWFAVASDEGFFFS